MRQLVVALLAASIATQASGEVVSIEIKEQRPWISGREFKSGQYELLRASFTTRSTRWRSRHAA